MKVKKEKVLPDQQTGEKVTNLTNETNSTSQPVNQSLSLEFRSDILLSEIQKVAGVTKTRSLMPILKNVLIELEGEEGRIYATDLEISAVTRFDLLGFKLDKSMGLVRLCINAALLQDVLKGPRPVSGLPFTMMIPAAKDKITIKQDNGLRYEACLALSDPDEFPEVKVLDEGEEVNISANLINEAIQKVSYAMSKDETRYILTGLCLQITEDELVAVGTDGFRMAVWKKKLNKVEKDLRVKGEGENHSTTQPLNGLPGFILPSNMVNILNALTDPKKVALLPLGPVTIKYGEESNVVQFALPTLTIISKRIIGQYPDCDAAIPPQNPHTLLVKRDAFIDALKRVMVLVAENDPVRISCPSGELGRGNCLLCLEVSSIAGTATEQIPALYVGESFDLAFNARFLLDVLQRLEGDTVNMHCPEGYAAVLIDEVTADGTVYQNVIMPIRT